VDSRELRTVLDEADLDLVNAFRSAGQLHVFRFLGSLPEEERKRLLEQARSIDLAELGRLLRESEGSSGDPRDVQPIEAIDPDDPDRSAAEEAGRDLLRRGRVAFLMVAGGQATRFGVWDGPKGTYPFAPASGKTLFRWHAEKLLAASRRYETVIPFIVMVSDATEGPTRAAFAENGWFGMEERIRFIRQRMLPAVDERGRILLSSPSQIALAPNGHGGVLEALGREGTLDWLEDRGIDLVSYFQVDNALLNPADPAFLGYHALRSAEMSVKVVEKRHPLEKAGVVCRMAGMPGVLEYSELPEDLAREQDASGRLRLRLANIAAHVFSLPFLRKVRDAGLPYHVATKEIPTVDEEGREVMVTGKKYETFVFDAIPLARGFNVFLTRRGEEFSPLKNAEGDNSPETVRRALLERGRAWYERAGRVVPSEEAALEVGPLVGYDFETFREHLDAHDEGELP
jgi:UDP-N-acetylglucosamine/UDP-N-acetylgalactosamine diphosphorylase